MCARVVGNVPNLRDGESCVEALKIVFCFSFFTSKYSNFDSKISIEFGKNFPTIGTTGSIGDPSKK